MKRTLVAVLLAFALGLALGSRASATTPRPASAPVTGVGPVVADPGLAEAPSPSPASHLLPSPAAASQPDASVAPSVPGAITGIASWYRYVPGQAAAGPRLRAMLGPGWRGMLVTVNGLPVRLSDWCQCFEGAPDERIIDLDSRTVTALGFRLSQGLYEVTIAW